MWSRYRVPRPASSSFPALAAAAPVNAPRSKPKSSLSMSPAGMLGRSTVTIGSGARGPQKWSACAARSFPVPLSPLKRTLVGAFESLFRSLTIATICGSRATMTVSAPGSGPGRLVAGEAVPGGFRMSARYREALRVAPEPSRS